MDLNVAEVIINLSVEALDRTFDYLIPDEFLAGVRLGTPVVIPFGKGNREITGYVVGIKNNSEYEADKLKSITAIRDTDIPVEGELISLAAWIKEHYGCTMNEAIHTVLPVKSRVKSVEEHWLNLLLSPSEALSLADKEESKSHVAKARVLRALASDPVLSLSVCKKEYKTTKSVVESLEKAGIISVSKDRIYRGSNDADNAGSYDITLTEEQRAAVDTFLSDYRKMIRRTYLIYGVTGSGKTEVYMEMLREVIADKKQAIVLIPEIALTHQTVQRFAALFGDRVTVLHSRMSAGERYDQFIRAKNHEVDIVVGPRSALFVPFDNLGLIVIDEEHEGSYQSEKNPNYHAREVAIERAKRAGASVVLGSATPSVETYKKANDGEYKLIRLNKRATGAMLPEVHVVDLREELKAKNHSIFSRLLSEKIKDRLDKGEQTMLFINRRGYAGFVSCRSCGFVVKCSHCDVSMTEHRLYSSRYDKNKPSSLVCHYCGDTYPMPDKCPECGSPYIASFGLGTEKVCELLNKEFPSARVLRMDADTTKNKGGHERVLAPFREGEADILVGTQMIVKGHDMPRVTLVGAIAADLSMYQSDYLSFEKTFDLLMQAGGRAGRGEIPGEFVIQTYRPDSYCIRAVLENDSEYFYEQELAFRKLGNYPPYKTLLKILVSSSDEKTATQIGSQLGDLIEGMGLKGITRIGPAPDEFPFLRDRHRVSLYIKAEDPNLIDEIMKKTEEKTKGNPAIKDSYINYYRSAV